jgi:two-component system chemotaxis response regulator CheB
VQEGKMLRFKCRVGHSFSAETMADSQDEAVERALWAALRSLEERVDLTKRLAERAAQGRHPMAERHWRAQSEISAKNADILRKTLSATETPTELGEQHDPKLAENA